jgi:putative inorganic carbon (hco3(-)) transporter
VNKVVIRRERLIVDRIFFMMIGLFVVLLGASLFARDLSIALRELARYVVEGIFLYFLVINVIRDWPTLRRVVWALLITGGVLGSLSVYQEITQDYSNEMGGLSQRILRDADGNLVSEVDDRRAYGPIGEANRYAQILLVLLPLGLFRFWHERSGKMRLFAGAMIAMIFAGIVLTYSRGAFVAIVAMTLMILLLRLVNFTRVAAFAAVAALAVVVLAPAYVQRIASIGKTGEVAAGDSEADADTSARRRLTSMLAGLNAFMDHPVLGVGPGQYVPYYSVSYQLEPNILDPHIPIRRLREDSRTHNLYLEIAAETGVIGLVMFMAIVISVLYPLYRRSRYFQETHPDFSTTAIGLWLGIAGYLIAGIFLHLAYQRYYWFLLAIAGAALQVFRNEDGRCAES